MNRDSNDLSKNVGMAFWYSKLMLFGEKEEEIVFFMTCAERFTVIIIRPTTVLELL